MIERSSLRESSEALGRQENEISCLLQHLKVLRTCTEGQYIMKKLVLLISAQNWGAELEEQMQLLMQRKEFYALTLVKIRHLEQTILLETCIGKLKQVQKFRHPNAKKINEVYSMDNQLILLCEYSSSPRLFPFLCS